MVGAMRTGGGFGHRWGSNVEFCVADMQAPLSTGLLTYWLKSVKQCIFQDFEFGVSVDRGGQHLLDNFVSIHAAQPYNKFT